MYVITASLGGAGHIVRKRHKQPQGRPGVVAIMVRLVALPKAAPIVPPNGMHPMTIFMLLVMSSVVAGVTEEAGFRVYAGSNSAAARR